MRFRKLDRHNILTFEDIDKWLIFWQKRLQWMSLGNFLFNIAFIFRYRSRFRTPYDLLYYRYNLYRQSTGTQKGTDAIFDPVDPSTPDFFDYDYDVNVNYGPGGSPLPNGILPEQAVALSNSRSRKARLWRKVYYLQYLRELYRRYCSIQILMLEYLNY